MKGPPNFKIFLSVDFFGKINLKQVEEQKTGSRGSESMLPRKFFENSLTVMAVLVHFEQFSSKVY